MAINDVRRFGSELHHYLKPIGPDGPAVRGKVCLDRKWRVCLDRKWDEGRHLFPAAAGRVIDASWKSAEIRSRKEDDRRRRTVARWWSFGLARQQITE